MSDELQQKNDQAATTASPETEETSILTAVEAVSSGMDPALLEEMAKAGVLYGRKKSKTHPKMRPFIHTTRNGIEIFDPDKTMQQIVAAADFLRDLAKRGGLLLCAGTQPAAHDLARAMGDAFAFPYVTTRWLGGTLTNFKTLSSRIQRFMNLKADRAAGKLEKYTKKERVVFDKEIERMEKLFGGLERLTRVPDALIIIDPTKHETAVREARRLHIPVVALASSDSNPELFQYPIPANASARQAIAWILARLSSAMEEGKKEHQSLIPNSQSPIPNTNGASK